MEFYDQSDINSKPLDNAANPGKNHRMAVYLTGLSVALVVVMMAILVHQFTL